MEWLTFTERTLTRHRQALIHFFQRYGDKRITKKGIDWLRKADPHTVYEAGNYMLYVLQGRKLVGVIIIVDYGREESFMAVHSKYRQQDIATQMVQRSIEELGKLYARVAMDNLPSLKICLANGMVAFKLISGPTGKPTLWLGGGDWKREDIHA